MSKTVQCAAAILFLALLAGRSYAGSAILSWEPPTTNSDGTPLTDLASYRLNFGCQGTGIYTGELILNAAGLSSYVLNDLPDVGTCYFVLFARNAAGVESSPSMEASKFMGSLPLPAPISTIAVSWAEAPPTTYRYSLPTTDFGPHVVAGNWNFDTSNIDIEFTITPDTFPDAWPRIISKATGTAEQDHVVMVSLSDRKIRFRLKTNGTTHTLIGNRTVNAGQAVAGRVTYDGQFMRIYFDGALDASLPKTGPVSQSSAPVWIGANPPNGASRFDGRIAVTVH